MNKQQCGVRPLILVLAAAFAVGPVWAANDGNRDRGERAERVDRGDRPDRADRRDDRRDDRRSPPPPRPGRPGPNGSWWDGAHGHNHYYPPPGRVVVTPPRHWNVVVWGGIDYRYGDGVWYTPSPRGYVVVRPPIGIVVHDLPSFRTVLTIAGITYLYVNGVYYREYPSGGYEVVPPPVAQPDAPPPDRMFVYPRQGQTAQQQASDEYECHRWAVQQTGFDPTGAATGQVTTTSTQRRDDYRRAQSACLEGRGYTVR